MGHGILPRMWGDGARGLGMPSFPAKRVRLCGASCIRISLGLDLYTDSHSHSHKLRL